MFLLFCVNQAGGAKVMYIQGRSAINLANEIFGYDGWSSEIRNSLVDFVDESDSGQFTVAVVTTVRITLKDKNYHEDVGYGIAENCKSKAAAFGRARKEAATDAMKRALRLFGNALGNCLYDTNYTKNVGNMSRPAVSIMDREAYCTSLTPPLFFYYCLIPFVPLELYRHPHIRKTIEEQMKRSSDNQTTTAKPSFPSTRPTTTQKQSVASKPATHQHVVSSSSSTVTPASASAAFAAPPPASVVPPEAPAPAPAPASTPNSSLSAYNNQEAANEVTPAKRLIDDNLDIELFDEDSFILDDDDDEFYAQVANNHSTPLSPPPSHANDHVPVQVSTKDSQSSKRQRQ
ncbi:unnamed protein product [Absidia cylindrospora]